MLFSILIKDIKDSNSTMFITLFCCVWKIFLFYLSDILIKPLIKEDEGPRESRNRKYEKGNLFLTIPLHIDFTSNELSSYISNNNFLIQILQQKLFDCILRSLKCRGGDVHVQISFSSNGFFWWILTSPRSVWAPVNYIHIHSLKLPTLLSTIWRRHKRGTT